MHTILLLLLSLSTSAPAKPMAKPVDIVYPACRVITTDNQIKCHKIVLGTFPDNPNWMEQLGYKSREEYPTLKHRENAPTFEQEMLRHRKF